MIYGESKERKGQGWDGWKNRSVNASAAYAGGEKPLSKWTAAAVIEAAESFYFCPIKRLAKPFKEFLVATAPHHIGSGALQHYVYFYEIDEKMLENEKNFIFYSEKELEKIKAEKAAEDARREQSAAAAAIQADIEAAAIAEETARLMLCETTQLISKSGKPYTAFLIKASDFPILTKWQKDTTSGKVAQIGGSHMVRFL